MGKVLKDAVFTAVRAAQAAKEKYGKEKVVDATLGSLYDEDGVLVALDSVWDVYDDIPHFEKAKYASDLQGNPDYREAVKKWLGLPDSYVVATPGGSGAVSVTFRNGLEAGEKLLLPSVFWGPYLVMAGDQKLKYDFYEMFSGNNFNIKSFKDKAEEVMAEQGKVLAVINDPAHNPTGYTMSEDEWVQVIDFLDQLATKGEVILLNDIAYIDFVKDKSKSRKHFKYFNNLHKNLTVVVAFSISKTFTAYGMRVGGAVILGDKKEEFRDSFVYTARSIWSNVNNSGMKLFSKIMEDEKLKETYVLEKEKFVKMLAKRSDIILAESKEVGLDVYPHVEGFFITVKVDPEIRDEVHNCLNDELIFTIGLPAGPRVALCSLPTNKCYGLAKKIKDIIDRCKG